MSAGLGRHSPLPRPRGTPRLRRSAERSLEFHRRRAGSAAHVRGRRKSRRPGDGRVRRRRMVGFALSVPGTRDRACLSAFAHAGGAQGPSQQRLGRRLKLLQREDALARGIELIEWTFDPLEIKNAYFNIEKLGAIARRYNINQYGITSSPLQGGLPSDRLIAEWWLKSKRVRNAAGDRKESAVRSQRLSIEVPAQIYEWKAAPETRSQAQQVQERNREAISAALLRGTGRAGLRARSARQRQVSAGTLGRELVVRIGVDFRSSRQGKSL